MNNKEILNKLKIFIKENILNEYMQYYNTNNMSVNNVEENLLLIIKLIYDNALEIINNKPAISFDELKENINKYISILRINIIVHNKKLDKELKFEKHSLNKFMGEFLELVLAKDLIWFMIYNKSMTVLTYGNIDGKKLFFPKDMQIIIN